jgi:hypothetical protein
MATLVELAYWSLQKLQGLKQNGMSIKLNRGDYPVCFSTNKISIHNYNLQRLWSNTTVGPASHHIWATISPKKIFSLTSRNTCVWIAHDTMRVTTFI